MSESLTVILRDVTCPMCLGAGSIRNPLSRPATWRRVERAAFKLVSSRPGISLYPRAWQRLRKLRNIARRYQSSRPCPRCGKRGRPTAAQVSRRLGVDQQHPHYAMLQDMERRDLLSWNWPESSLTLYTIERLFSQESRP